LADYTKFLTPSNLLRRIPGKSSMKGKRFKIALSEDFLLLALRI
jgi:hypothetical protein